MLRAKHCLPVSVPDKRGVSGQKPDKVTYMTRQTDRKLEIEIMGIDPLEFGIDTQAWKCIWNPDLY